MYDSTRNASKRRARGALLSAFLAIAVAVPATAAPPSDLQSWTPWIGCWRPVAVSTGAIEAGIVCVAPNEAAGGVDIRTVVGGEVVAQRTLVADGTRHDVERAGCAGWEQVTWSHDGRRVYLKSELDCENGLRRYASGVIAMASATEWLDIQSVLVGGSRDMAVRRLLPAEPELAAEHGVTESPAFAASAARIDAAAPLTVDDVIDASAVVDREVVEALLLEHHSTFDLNAHSLTRLADAGVPSRLIDLMIGVSFPDEFVVNRNNRVAAERPEAGATYADYRGGYYDPLYDPWGFGGLGYGYSRYYNYYDPFYYSPFAGPSGWGYGWSTRYSGPIIIARPENQGNSGSRGGRMVRGQGYVPSSSSNTSRSGTRSTNSSASTASTSSSSSSSASSSSGSSSGSSTRRTATRRGGGGGGA